MRVNPIVRYDGAMAKTTKKWKRGELAAKIRASVLSDEACAAKLGVHLYYVRKVRARKAEYGPVPGSGKELRIVPTPAQKAAILAILGRPMPAKSPRKTG